VLEVAGDLAVLPGEQDRCDVRVVLVQRRAPDAGLFGGRWRCRRSLDGVLNVITVRAGAAGLRHEGPPERSLRDLEAIEEVARQTAVARMAGPRSIY
jgi:hypothetical protein